MFFEEYMKKPLEERQSHINLSEACIERGGISTQHRGVLVEYLGTHFPTGQRINLCHACENEKCSNPHHLYWGSASENLKDALRSGRKKNFWDSTVAKYGLEKAREIVKKSREACARGGRANAGKPKSEEHRRKLSEANAGVAKRKRGLT
jgi:hypothetical protein